MSQKLSLLALVVALLALFIVWSRPVDHTMAPHKETAFERVTRTNTLRCGYGIWAPGLVKDPLTGKLSGIFYDYLEALGKHAGIKIDWTQEIGWADFPTALNNGRIDAMCFGAWPIAEEAREVLFTKSIYYLPVNAYAREGDTRFDHAIEKINVPNITISVMDAELSNRLAIDSFPKAKTFSIPQISSSSMILLNVAMKKADVTFTDAWTAKEYVEHNPGKIRLVPSDHPLRLFGHTIPISKGEHDLLNLLNTATDEIRDSGELDQILDKYDPQKNALMRSAKPYGESQ